MSTPTLPELEEMARELGRSIKATMLPGTGFVCVLFDFGGAGTGSMTYLSNANREDTVKMLRELLGKIEGPSA